MNIIAVIPVHGRLPLLKLTIERLYLKNNITHVICIGEEENRDTCEKAGAEFIYHTNKPIGRKLNIGFKRARELKPDAVSFVGSSDWLSDNWFIMMVPYLDKYSIIGKRTFNMVHKNYNVIVAEWQGYVFGTGREQELIGIGRICSPAFLDSCDWKPFDDDINCSLDYSMWTKMKRIPLDAKEFTFDSVHSLSVSCDKWENMHGFWSLLRVSIINPEPFEWLNKWFPEIFDL